MGEWANWPKGGLTEGRIDPKANWLLGEVAGHAGDGDRVGEEKIYRGGEFGAGAPSPPNPKIFNSVEYSEATAESPVVGRENVRAK